MASERRTGIVTRKIEERGFGFIQEEGQTISLFVHANDLRGNVGWDNLREGDRVTYTVEVTDKGERARVVRVE